MEGISKEEVIHAIIESPKQKAPGNDGIPFEFYTVFQNTILTDILTHQCNQTLQHSDIPESWNSTNTILIHKKNNRNDLRNWRPIALINTDSKIFSRILTHRLQEITKKCINRYQTGFIRGRYIADNAASALLIMEHAQKMKKTAAHSPCMIMLDQEKAYDRVHPKYLASTLKHFGFPDQFIRCISKLFFHTKTRIAINGYLTRPIKQQRGLRQGDALSPLLYNLMLEPLLRSFQQQLTGYKLNNTLSLKCMAYADDTILFINTPSELHHSMQIYDQYASASNAKLNNSKTIGVAINGALQPWQSHFPQYQWFDSNSPTCPTYLGYPLSISKRHHKSFYDQITQKILRHANLLCDRSISQAGRILIINSLLTSKLWHVARLIPPNSHIHKINGILRNFFWNYRKPTIAWNLLCQPKHNVGMGIIPIPDQAQALLVRHIIPLFTPTHPFRSFFHDILEEILKQLSDSTDHWPTILSSSSFPQLLNGFTVLTNFTKILRSIKIYYDNVQMLPSTLLSLPLSMFLQPSTLIPTNLLRTPLNHFLRGWPPQPHPMISATSNNEPQYKRKKLKKLLTDHKAEWVANLPFEIDWFTEALENAHKPLNSKKSLQDIAKEACIGSMPISCVTTAIARSLISEDIVLPSTRLHISCTQNFYTTLWKLPIPQYDKVVWWKLSLSRWPTRQRLHHLYTSHFLNSICEICYSSSEDTDHMLLQCPPKHRFWKYVRILMNLWSKPNSYIPLNDLQAQHIIEGFKYPWSKITLRENPTTMIILTMAISTIWKKHWSFIFREDRTQSFTYDLLKKAMWKTLHDRIMDDTRISKDKSIWIRKGLVDWTTHGVHIHHPSIHIAE